MSQDSWAIIANPTAGRSRAERAAKMLAQAIQELGVPVEVSLTNGPGNARELARAAVDAGATMLLIDVREDYEVESGSIPGSIHIPLGQLEDRMSDIPRDVRLVFF